MPNTVGYLIGGANRSPDPTNGRTDERTENPNPSLNHLDVLYATPAEKRFTRADWWRA